MFVSHNVAGATADKSGKLIDIPVPLEPIKQSNVPD